MTRGPPSMLTKQRPLFVGGGAVYPYSEALERHATLESRFGDPYELFRRGEDGTLWLPRQLCPAPTHESDRRSAGEGTAYACNFTPRNEEQARIVHHASELLFQGKNFIVQAPTGWGKTIVGCAIAGRVKRKTLVITTKEDIIDQWVDAAQKVLGLTPHDIGIWRADEVPDNHHRFIVGLVQSVLKGPERYPDFDYEAVGLVICDEVHRMAADQFSQAMWWFPAKLRMGLSATPYRKDGKEMVFKGHIGEVQLTATQETMVPRIVVRRSGWKVPIVTWYGKTQRLPHEAGKLGHVLKFLAREKPRNRMIAKFAGAAYRKQRNLIIFSDTLDHLYALRQALPDEGVPLEDVGFYVGVTSGKRSPYTGSVGERKKQREQAKAKPVILATYAMASEATDIPWLDACVLATPRSDVVQIVGRIRREYPDKKQPVVLDIVDDDSRVFAAYWAKRYQWYKSLGCEIRVKS